MIIKVVNKHNNTSSFYEGKLVSTYVDLKEDPADGQTYEYFGLSISAGDDTKNTIVEVRTGHVIAADETGNICSNIDPNKEYPAVYLMNNEGQTIERLS